MDGEGRPGYRLFLKNIADSDFSDTALAYLGESGKTALVYLGEAKRFFTDVVAGLQPGLESARERTIEGYQNLKQEGQRLSKIVKLAGYHPKNVVQNVVKGFKAKREQLSQLIQKPLISYKNKDDEERPSTSEK